MEEKNSSLLCEMQKCLPPTFFNAQEHYLIHLVEEIELCGPVHSRSMWMVERHLKSLKALVRQRAHPEGSMVEGYMVYQTMVYITEYLPKFASNIRVDRIWDLEPFKKLEGEYLIGKGTLRKVKGAREWDALHLYIANNLDWMTVWIERCQHSGRTLTWEGVSSLVKEAHRNGDSNVTQREIDLAHGLRDLQVRTNLLITRMFINS